MIYDAFMNGPESVIELFHGYTYSGHPLACAAALATLDVYRDERLFERAKTLEPKWYDAIMGLKGLPNVLDIRCVGLTGAIDLAPVQGSPGERVRRALDHAFFDAGIMIRPAGDTIELTPPLDRERGPDRRDHGQGRRFDQSGGLRPLSVPSLALDGGIAPSGRCLQRIEDGRSACAHGDWRRS